MSVQSFSLQYRKGNMLHSVLQLAVSFMAATAVTFFTVSKLVKKGKLKGRKKFFHALTYMNIIPHFNSRPFGIRLEYFAPQQKSNLHLLTSITYVFSFLSHPLPKKPQLAQSDKVWHCQIVSINVADLLCVLMANTC